MRVSEAVGLALRIALLIILAPVILVYVVAFLDAARRRDWGGVALLGGSAALSYFLFEKYVKRWVERWVEWLVKVSLKPSSW